MKRRGIAVELPDDLSSKSPSPVDLVDTQDRIEDVEKAIADLPAREKRALVLCSYEQKSHKEIAEIMECTVSTVKALIYKARQKLRKRFHQTRH